MAKWFIMLLSGITFAMIAAEDTSIKVVLFPFRQAIIAANIDSSVTRHSFREGESFRADDVLFTLDDRIFKQRLLRSHAASREAVAGVNFAQRNLERTKDLFTKGMQGKQDVEKAELELEVAIAKKEAQDASLALAGLELAFCRVPAPFSGRVVKRVVQEHEYVRVGQPLIQIIDDHQLLAVMHLESGELPRLATGQEMTVRIDETKSVHKGKIHEIAGEIDPGSRTVEIKLLIQNKDLKLRSGMSGSLVRSVQTAKAGK